MKINSNTVDSFLKNIPNGLQFFLVYGHEPSQITQIKQQILNTFSKDNGMDDLNISNIDFSKVKDNFALLTDEMASNSLFGGRRIIILENCPATLPKDFANILKSAKGDPVVIFLADELKPTSSLRKNFETLPNCVAIACYKDDKSSMQRYIRETLSKKGVQFTPDIPSILAEILPANRMLVNSEIEKLITYKSDDESPINIEDIRDIITEASELALDDLCMAIALRNSALTQKGIANLISNNENFVFIVRVLLKYFARIYEVKSMVEQGMSMSDAVSKLSPPVFFKQKDNLIMVCNKISLDRATALIKRLLKLELECKNSSISPELLTFNTLTHLSRAA